MFRAYIVRLPTLKIKFPQYFSTLPFACKHMNKIIALATRGHNVVQLGHYNLITLSAHATAHSFLLIQNNVLSNLPSYGKTTISKTILLDSTHYLQI